MRGDIVTGNNESFVYADNIFDRCKFMPLFTNKNFGGMCEREAGECKKCIDMKERENA